MSPLAPPATYVAQLAQVTRDLAGAITGVRVTLTTVSCPAHPMTLRSDGHGEF